MLVLSSLVIPFIVNRFGRKLLLSVGLLFQVISYLMLLFSLLFSLKILIVISIYLFLFFFFLSTGGLLFLYQVEIMPGELLPIINTFQWCLAIIIGFFSLPIINAIGIFALFLIFMFIGLVGWILVEGFCIETAGKTKNQVMLEFNSKKFFQ